MRQQQKGNRESNVRPELPQRLGFTERKISPSTDCREIQSRNGGPSRSSSNQVRSNYTSKSSRSSRSRHIVSTCKARRRWQTPRKIEKYWWVIVPQIWYMTKACLQSKNAADLKMSDLICLDKLV